MTTKAEFLEAARKHAWLGVDYILAWSKARYLPSSSLHKDWHRTVDKAKRDALAVKQGILSPDEAKTGAVIFSPREHGKCMTGDTLITLADGRLKYVIDVKVGDKVVAYDTDSHSFVASKVTDVFNNGKQPVYEVTLASNRSITVTAEHPFLTEEGWKTISDNTLQVGDKVAVPLKVPRTNIRRLLNKKQLKLIGYFCGGIHYLPTDLFSMPEEDIKFFIKHLWTRCKYNQDTDILSYQVFIEYIAKQISTLLSYIGVPNIIIHEMGTYIVRVVGTRAHKIHFLVDILDADNFDESLLEDTPSFTSYSKYVWFDEIVSIKPVGEYETYGITVDKYNTHITNGMITHNSSQLVVGRTVWELGNNPDMLIKIVCECDDSAYKRIMAISKHIEQNRHVHELFPHLKPAEKSLWNKSTLYVKRQSISTDASVEGVGILSAATGARADLIIFDDVVSFTNAVVYPTKQKVIKEAFYENWLNILGSDGWFIYVFTPWSKEDLSMELINKTDTYYVYIKVIDDDFNPVWPEKWPKEKLKKHAEKIGMPAFARGFQGKVVSRGEELFSKESIFMCMDPVLSQFPIPVNDDWQYFTGVDLGIKKKKENARTCIFTIGITPEKERVPVSIIVGNFSSPMTARLLIDEYEKYKPQLVLVENNGYQEALIEWMAELGYADIPIEGYFTGNQKFDETLGLPSLALEFRKKLWRIPDNTTHSKDCQCPLCIWLDELVNYGSTKFSDTVMASFFAREAYRKISGEGMYRQPSIRILNYRPEDEESELVRLT